MTFRLPPQSAFVTDVSFPVALQGGDGSRLPEGEQLNLLQSVSCHRISRRDAGRRHSEYDPATISQGHPGITLYTSTNARAEAGAGTVQRPDTALTKPRASKA